MTLIQANGTPATAHALVDDFEVTETFRLPSNLSAQAAKLFALRRACILAQGHSLTVYTDSAYDFTFVHDTDTIWKHRGFLTSSGKPIAHFILRTNLLNAITLPSLIVVCKCKAHTNTVTLILFLWATLLLIQ